MSQRTKHLFICILLATALAVTGCGGAPAPTNTPVPPTNTPVPPTNTPAAGVGTEKRVEEGGFAFRSPADYGVEVYGSAAFVSPPDADDQTGPFVILGGGPTAGGLLEGATSVEDAFAKAKTGISPDGAITISEPTPITVGGVKGLSADLSGSQGDIEMGGRLVVVMPEQGNVFALAAVATAEKWKGGFGDIIQALLDSVTFFTPVVPTAAPEPTALPTP